LINSRVLSFDGNSFVLVVFMIVVIPAQHRCIVSIEL